METKELLELRRNEILELAAKHGAKNIRIFGSVARGEGGPASDVDFLVDYGRRAESAGFGGVLARPTGALELSCRCNYRRRHQPVPSRADLCGGETPVKEERVYLLHIRDAVERALSYTAQGKLAFFADPRTQDAVIRNLEVVGEAVKNLSEGLKARHATVPWKRIAGMRDKMIHEYFGVNLQLVWDAVEQSFRALSGKSRQSSESQTRETVESADTAGSDPPHRFDGAYLRQGLALGHLDRNGSGIATPHFRCSLVY